jgi:predicted RNA-binding Zn-ribbon protein involved in translation (DUF1610 family)
MFLFILIGVVYKLCVLPHRQNRVLGGKTNEMVCRNCGFVGMPLRKTPGTFAIELILWLFFIVPGLCYTIWRTSNRYTACPKCGARDMIPIDSPIAQKLLKE